MLRNALKRNTTRAVFGNKPKRHAPAEETKNEVTEDKIADKLDENTEIEDEKDLEVLVLGTHSDYVANFENDGTNSSQVNASMPAWHDDDDEIEIQKSTDTTAWINSKSQNSAVARRLRENKFKESLGTTPSWAQVQSEVIQENDEDSLLRGSHHYKASSKTLPGGTLKFSQVKDANYGNAEADLTSCEFHKSAQIALMVSSLSRLSLYQIDGKNNSKLHSLFLEKFPIKDAHFLQNGEEILMSSKRVKYLNNYNIVTGKLGTINTSLGFEKKEFPNKFKVSSCGKYIVMLSTFGDAYLLSAKTKEIIGKLQANDPIIDFDFMENSGKLISLSRTGSFHIWDLQMQQCYHSFTDQGLFGATNIACSPNGNYISCGSESGIVSVYDDSCLNQSNVSPIKELKNLRSSVSSIVFNSTSEIIAVGSEVLKNSVKLMHMKSLTAFNNFPINVEKNKNMIRLIDFSPNSGYLMLGNRNGRANLYRLHHYSGY